MTRCRALLLVLSFCGTLPASLYAQSQPRRPTTEVMPRTYSIRGTLRAATDESTVTSIKVELRRFSGEVVGLVFTRSNGEFEFGGLTSGEYVLHVDEDGFESVREKVEILQASRVGIQLYLKKPLRLGQQPDGPSVSARELALSRKARDSLRKGRQQLFDRNDPTGSVGHFRRTLTEAPDFYEAQHLMAIAFMDMGQFAEAEKALRECIDASKGKFADAHFALAAVLSNGQRFTEALAAARAGIAIDAAAWQGPFELARALFHVNQVDEAAQQLQLVRERNPAFAPAYLLSVNVNLRRRNHPAVLRDLEEYLRLEPAGVMSQQAREMRDTLLKAQNTPAPAPPKP